MNNLKITLITTSLFLSFTTLTFSQQDYAVAENTINPTVKSSKMINYDTESSVLKNNTFTYEYGGKDVIVVFDNNEHTEYYNNKKHYIKSELTWINESECVMTIKEVTLPGLPFKAGTQMEMKITKTKGDYVYYESTLGGRTWEGKMKLSSYNEHF